MLPVPFELEKRPDTVRELVTALVRLSVSEYNERKEEGQVLRYLTKEEISSLASAGKVSFGVRGGNDADPEKAVENALQCFEDGIYRDICRRRRAYRTGRAGSMGERGRR